MAYTRLGVAVQHFKRAGSMKVQYTLDKNAKMFLVHKEEWSWAELLDIATESVYFSSNKFWMLPNRAKILSLNEAIEFSKFLCNTLSPNFDSDYRDTGEWETIGCIRDEEMT